MNCSAVKKYVPAYLAGVLASVGLLLWLSTCLDDAPKPYPTGKERKFNRELWLADSSAIGGLLRAEMVDDLQRHYLRRGMTKAEVLSLLGNYNRLLVVPPVHNCFSRVWLSYSLGPMSTHDVGFIIELDSMERAVGYRAPPSDTY